MAVDSIDLQRCCVVYSAHADGLWLSKREFAEQFTSVVLPFAEDCGKRGFLAWLARSCGSVLLSSGCSEPAWSQFEVILHLPRRMQLPSSLDALCISSPGWVVRLVRSLPRGVNWKPWVEQQLWRWSASEPLPRSWFGAGYEDAGVDIDFFVKYHPVVGAATGQWVETPDCVSIWYECS